MIEKNDMAMTWPQFTKRTKKNFEKTINKIIKNYCKKTHKNKINIKKI